jgi:hypothetical protein
MFFGCLHHACSGMSSAQVPTRARIVFGLYSMLSIFFGGPVQRVFSVCRLLHCPAGREAFWIVFYIVYVLWCPHQVCSGMSSAQVSTVQPGEDFRIFGLYSIVYMFYGCPHHVCSGMSSAPLSSRARRHQGSPSPPRWRKRTFINFS